ncbi:Kynureninase (L-kynurenine hydrolase) [Sorochytrium milnesiophthora]
MTSTAQEHPLARLQQVAAAQQLDITSLQFARHLDATDELSHLRDKYVIPRFPVASKPIGSGEDRVQPDHTVYLCGNSLGVQPKETKQLLTQELDVWAERASGVHGHFDHPHERPWLSIDETVVAKSATVVGALPHEVAVMNTLTGNLHLLLVSFFRPTAARFKIIIEAKAFPSDHYAVESQLRFHNIDPAVGLITLKPRQDEYILRPEDILDAIDKEGDQVALVMLSGVQYYTGQLFDIKRITKAGHSKGCVVGWDLAHAVGNVPLRLHDWNVDFAAWCTYKYLNAGPGAIAGAFVHDKHGSNKDAPRFAGWWGHDKATRFQMKNEFVPMAGAAGYQLSNPSVVSTVCLLASLNVFASTSMDRLRSRSLLLTAYLEHLLQQELVPSGRVRIITPADVNQRGSQLSLLLSVHVKNVMKGLEERGCVGDEREPNVIRVAPTAMYNRFEDCWTFVTALKEVLDSLPPPSSSS